MNDSRIYGVDLFKALAMFLVVLLHINTVGGVFAAAPAGTAAWLISDALQSASYCCVNCFALATGFLMAERPFRVGRIVPQWLQAAFYSLLSALLCLIVFPGSIGIKDFAGAFLPVLTGKYWYFTAYFVLFFFTPFLNSMLSALQRRGRLSLLAALFVFMSLIPTLIPMSVIPLSGGYCVFWLAVMYIFGAVIKLERLYRLASKRIFMLVYCASVLLILAWRALRCYLFAAEDNILLSYISPAVLLCSAALLCAFANLHVGGKHRRLAVFLSSTSFGVYLIHTCGFVWDNYFVDGFVQMAQLPAALLLPAEVVAALGIYAACSIIEYIRQKLFAVCRINRLSERISLGADRILMSRTEE